LKFSAWFVRIRFVLNIFSSTAIAARNKGLQYCCCVELVRCQAIEEFRLSTPSNPLRKSAHHSSKLSLAPQQNGINIIGTVWIPCDHSAGVGRILGCFHPTVILKIEELKNYLSDWRQSFREDALAQVGHSCSFWLQTTINEKRYCALTNNLMNTNKSVASDAQQQLSYALWTQSGCSINNFLSQVVFH